MDVSEALFDPAVLDVVGPKQIGPGLQQIFDFYVEASDLRRKKAVALETRMRNEMKRGLGQIATTSKKDVEALKALSGKLCYKEYAQFCQDYTLTENALLSTVELGEAYLSTIQGQLSDDDALPSLTFEDFLQVSTSTNPSITYRDNGHLYLLTNPPQFLSVALRYWCGWLSRLIPGLRCLSPLWIRSKASSCSCGAM